ncbi:MAG TPA: 4Fe-4S dicluster domain-containing protein [Thermoflexia bacterium]|nr:4Fe-4S dicluster domain-containing protein [Thermoflexia bacterium]
MKLKRREFLKVVGAATGALLLPPRSELIARASSDSPCDSKGVLVDLTKCIGCGWCQEACSQQNDLSPEEIRNWSVEQDPLPLSANTWTLVTFKEMEQGRVFAKRQCMHCVHPACVSACPVSALEKNEYGAVVYDAARCIGCRYCMVACPFGIPKIEWDKPIPLIRKCTFCADRQEEGLEPACTSACPTGALLFGDRAALITEAKARIEEHSDQYVNHIYGKDELGGTSWMYISPVSFEELGFPILGEETVTGLSETVAAAGTPAVALGVALFLSSIYYRSKSKTGTHAHAATHPRE